MQRTYFGIAIAALTTLVPAMAWGGDREIAKQVISRLNESRESGQLKDFTLDMKVDKGVVLFRGNVGNDVHKQIVLGAAKGIEGINGVVDEVTVTSATATAVKPEPAQVLKRQVLTPIAVPQPANVATPQTQSADVQPIPATQPVAAAQPAAVAQEASQPTLGQALAAEARGMQNQDAPAGVSNEIQRTAAIEQTSDQQVVSGVIQALKTAKRNGRLRGFGVDVKSRNGVLQLNGRAASADQRDQIVRIAEGVPGVSGIREAIKIPTSADGAPQLPTPNSLQSVGESNLTPLNPPVATRRTPAIATAAPQGVPAMTAPHRMPPQGAPMQAMPAGVAMGMSAPVVGQPVPMAPHSPVGAPRYDSPNLPNYAWPGYAAYPNYAALTYPQQYSPSAWPYIGPFYPYPQVPLGWRKISLEWDDGWWFLDFTSK